MVRLDWSCFGTVARPPLALTRGFNFAGDEAVEENRQLSAEDRQEAAEQDKFKVNLTYIFSFSCPHSPGSTVQEVGPFAVGTRGETVAPPRLAQYHGRPQS